MRWLLIKKRRKRVSSVTPHYVQHKEKAREVIVSKIHYWNQLYGFEFNSVAIRNQKRCWGSCTSLKNLNFSYKLLFLPEHLQDYIVVHELCHLQELHHRNTFWSLVEQQIPDYVQCIAELRKIEKGGVSPKSLDALKKNIPHIDSSVEKTS